MPRGITGERGARHPPAPSRESRRGEFADFAQTANAGCLEGHRTDQNPEVCRTKSGFAGPSAQLVAGEVATVVREAAANRR
jgi:hypothetical protein